MVILFVVVSRNPMSLITPAGGSTKSPGLGLCTVNDESRSGQRARLPHSGSVNVSLGSA